MDTYRRSGRGGAGNYYSQQQIDAAATPAAPATPDVEAQRPPVADDPPPAPSQPAPGYARSGRGGAGNFVDAAAAADQQQQQQPDSRGATGHATGHPPAGSLGPRSSGRGGAGNITTGASVWTDDATQESYEAEQERRRRAALDAEVRNTVHAGLAQPPKVYHLHAEGHIARGRGNNGRSGGGAAEDEADV